MGRKRRRSPEPSLVFFGPVTRKEIEVRRKLGLFENPDKKINMEDLDDDFWDYYYADENENLNVSTRVQKTPKKLNSVGKTLHLSLLKEGNWKNGDLVLDETLTEKRGDVCIADQTTQILAENVSNRSTRQKTRSSSKVHEMSEVAEISESKRTGVRPSSLLKMAESDVDDFIPATLTENIAKKSTRKTRSSKIDLVKSSVLVAETDSIDQSKISEKSTLLLSHSSHMPTNDDAQMPETSENVQHEIPKRKSRRLSNSRSSQGHSLMPESAIENVQMTESENLVHDSIPLSHRLSNTQAEMVENVIENDCRMPETSENDTAQRSSRRLSNTRSSKRHSLTSMPESAGTVENVINNDSMMPESSENDTVPQRSSRRLSNTRSSKRHSLTSMPESAGTVENVINNDSMMPESSENDTVPQRSSRRLSNTRSSKRHSLTSMPESAGTIENVINNEIMMPESSENDTVHQRSSRCLSNPSKLEKAHNNGIAMPGKSGNVNHTPRCTPQSKANGVSPKRKSNIPLSVKTNKILQNIKNAGVVKTPKSKISMIPQSSKLLSLSGAKNVKTLQNTSVPIKTPFSANKSSNWQRKSTISTPKASPMVRSAFGSTINTATPAWDVHRKTPLSSARTAQTPKPQKGRSETPLSLVRTLQKNPKLQIGRSETPLSSVRTLQKTPKPQIGRSETPLSSIRIQNPKTPKPQKGRSVTPLSSIKIMYRTPKPEMVQPSTPLSAIKIRHERCMEPMDIFNISSSANKTEKCRSRLSSSAKKRPSIVKSSASKIRSPMIRYARSSRQKTSPDDQPKTNWEVTASSSKKETVTTPTVKKSPLEKVMSTPQSTVQESATPLSLKHNSKLCSFGKIHSRLRTPQSKRSPQDTFMTPNSFEVSKNYSFTPDVPKAKPNFLKAPKLLVNGQEIKDSDWTSKLNPKKVVQAKRPNYIYSPSLLSKKPN